MKKFLYASVLLLFMITLGAASVWEGAAAAASSGSLPDSGFYAATNSFPKNTIVDVENLETGKTVRVIVVDALDSPGLLAVLSREAAEEIGLRNRTMGRIRMTMPADPIAFSRFTEGLGTSGDPDRDPAAALASSAPILDSLSTGPALAEEESQAESETETEIEQIESIAAIDEEDLIEQNIQEPDDTLSGSEEDIIDVPESFMPPPLEDDPDISVLSDITPVIQPEMLAEPDNSVFAEAEEPETDTAENPELSLETPLPEDEDIFLEEAEQDLAVHEEDIPVETVPEIAPEEAKEEAEDLLPELADAPALPPEQDDVILSLIPAEERPPEQSTAPELPPESEIPLIADVPEAIVEETLPPEAELFAEEPVEEEPLVQEQIPEADIIASSDSVKETAIDEADIIPSVEQSGHQEAVSFSVPLIEELEKDMYYLQLGAFTKLDLIESAISKLDKSYPVRIQRSIVGSGEVYRILVGPVNLGESAALLQRFKRSGYQDAFIRQEG